MDSRLYDITTHITTSVIFSKVGYGDFGHQVEESYRFRCRILCENDLAVEAQIPSASSLSSGAWRIAATE